jgi:hypothetical protein
MKKIGVFSDNMNSLRVMENSSYRSSTVYKKHTHTNVANDTSEYEHSTNSEISGSHGSEYEDDCLLGCCAV